MAETSLPFSPNALLNAVGNSLTSPLLNSAFKVKGVYKSGKGVNYNGVYYDILKDEFTDANIALVTPQQLRSHLQDGQQIEAAVFLSKRFQQSTGRIDLLLSVTEIISKKEKVIDESEVKSFDIIQKKVKAGYKDANSFIKTRLFEQKPIRVTILIGLTAIIDNDIKHQVKEAVVAYQFNYVKINLSQINEIKKALRDNDNTGILVIARGGGENMQIFDNPDLCETALTLRSIFITALGHTTDTPLLQKVADKAFITPTALGQYFHDLYNSTLDEFNHSRAKLISDLTQQISLNYQTQLQTLNTRLADVTSTSQETIRWAENNLSEVSSRMAKAKTTNAILYTVVIALAAILIYLAIKKA